jgi:hypothetical protein
VAVVVIERWTQQQSGSLAKLDIETSESLIFIPTGDRYAQSSTETPRASILMASQLHISLNIRVSTVEPPTELEGTAAAGSMRVAKIVARNDVITVGLTIEAPEPGRVVSRRRSNRELKTPR